MKNLLKKIRAVENLDDLENLEIGNTRVDISYRGGGIGFESRDVSSAFDVPDYYLPRFFGAACNYMGGGLRGSVFPSNYSENITGKRKIELLDALSAACVRVYESIENESMLNDDQYPDGETNWEAVGTKSIRRAGITSAY